MADFNKLKDTIRGAIYPNGRGAISADKHQAALLDMADTMQETAAQVTELSEETDKRLAESEKSTGEQIRALENKTNNKFAGVETELDNLKKGEAYMIEETLVFRNYATAQIIGNTLTL